jgi:hypothetical protein
MQGFRLHQLIARSAIQQAHPEHVCPRSIDKHRLIQVRYIYQLFRRVPHLPGASEQARRVKIVNANWTAASDGDDGRFQLMIVTEDDEKHVVTPSPASMTAMIALTQAHTVLVWDPDDRTLIAANVVGRMPWTERSQSGTVTDSAATLPSPR